MIFSVNESVYVFRHSLPYYVTKHEKMRMRITTTSREYVTGVKILNLIKKITFSLFRFHVCTLFLCSL